MTIISLTILACPNQFQFQSTWNLIFIFSYFQKKQTLPCLICCNLPRLLPSSIIFRWSYEFNDVKAKQGLLDMTPFHLNWNWLLIFVWPFGQLTLAWPVRLAEVSHQSTNWLTQRCCLGRGFEKNINGWRRNLLFPDLSYSPRRPMLPRSWTLAITNTRYL